MEINIDDIEGTGSVTSESLSDNDGEDQTKQNATDASHQAVFNGCSPMSDHMPLIEENKGEEDDEVESMNKIGQADNDVEDLSISQPNTGDNSLESSADKDRGLTKNIASFSEIKTFEQNNQVSKPLKINVQAVKKGDLSQINEQYKESDTPGLDQNPKSAIQW